MRHAGMHTARREDLDRLWPALHRGRLFSSREELEAFHAEAPWRVLVAEDGRAAVVERWRDHLDILAVRGLWCSSREIPRHLDTLRSLAAAQGFSILLSPLVLESASRPYREAGMRVHERIVALRGDARTVGRTRDDSKPFARLRLALPSDMPSLLSLDGRCFDEFWRYGPRELAEYMAEQRTVVAETSSAGILGYTLATVEGGTGTIGRLAVAPERRRGRVGSALLQEVIDWMLRTGVSNLSLCTQETNAASRSLYSKFGFREQRERLLFLSCEARKQPGRQDPGS